MYFFPDQKVFLLAPILDCTLALQINPIYNTTKLDAVQITKTVLYYNIGVWYNSLLLTIDVLKY